MNSKYQKVVISMLLRMHHNYTLWMFSNLIIAKKNMFVIKQDNKFIDSIWQSSL